MPGGILSQPTLVLNRNWQPIPNRDGGQGPGNGFQRNCSGSGPGDFSNIFLGRLVPDSPEDSDRFVQAVTFRLKAPEVVAAERIRPYAGQRGDVQSSQSV